MIKHLFSALILLGILGAIGCSDDFVDGEIPPATFNDIYIDLSLPQYQDLSINGGYIYLNEGVRGIILYRVNSTTYNAFERNCSYLPYEAGSTVEVHSSNLFLSDPSCGSSFSVNDGTPTGGPARIPLRRYTIIRSGGNAITITDDPLL